MVLKSYVTVTLCTPYGCIRQTVDLAVDWRCLIAAVVLDVDFHDAGVHVEHVVEVLWRLVAVEDAAERVVPTHRLRLVS